MDRFDLEVQICQLDNYVDDINDLAYGILELDMTEDDIVNALHGLATMMKIKNKKLFDTFTQVFHLDQFNDYNDHGVDEDEND